MQFSFNSKIAEALAEFFNLPIENISSYYKQLIGSSANNNTLASQGFIEIPKFTLSNVFTKEVKDKWSAATLTGLDLPILITKNHISQNSVLILGTDPLRNRRDFPLAYHQNVIIGTPYAVHSNYYRESKKRTKVYWDFIVHISQNSNVYLTDIFKIWMNDSTKDENKKYPLNFSIENWIRILKFEINSINPFKIITFGNLAYEICKSTVDDSFKNKIIPLPHPSGRNQKWNTLIAGTKTVEAKIKYLCLECDKIL